MKLIFKNCVILLLLFVGGCVPFWRQWMREKPLPPSRTIPAHESWCYKTIGQIDCYPGPQRLPPESLVSVDPPTRFPLTRADHAKALSEYQMSGKK